MEHMVATMTPNEIKDWVQTKALRAWKDNSCRGTIEAATGVGKTRIAVLAAAEELEKNPGAVVYIAVPTETLRDDDWPAEFDKWGYGHLNTKVKRVCHASMDTVTEERGEIDLLIFDEVHNITLNNSKIFTSNKVFKILGLTATIPPNTGYEIDTMKRLLIDTNCPSVYQVSLEEAIELRLVSDFEVKVLLFDLDDRELCVDGGTKKKSYKTTEKARYDYLTKMLKKAAWMKPEMKFVWTQKRMHFLYTLPTKEVLAREVLGHILTDKGNPKRTLIFCGGIDQTHTLCDDWVYHSKSGDRYLKKFQSLEIPYLGVCQALNEGKNIEALDQILIVQLNSKALDLIQRIGRAIRFRPGHVAQVVILVAKQTADEKWYREAFLNFDKRRIKEFYVKPTISRTKAA